MSLIFNQEYWNYAKLISALLRGGSELDKVVKIIDGMHFESDTLNTWKNGVKRAIKNWNLLSNNPDFSVAGVNPCAM